MKKALNYIVVKIILSPFLSFYEHYFMYRIRDAWGVVHQSKIKNKGKNVKLVGYSRFLNPENIKLGNNIRIGYGCFFFGKGGIEIGDNTILSRNITIYSSNHNYNSDIIPYDNSYVNKPVIIGRGVWIGMNVCITPGVHIGDGAIIGMGAVVSQDVSPGGIVVGAKQREVGSRNMDVFNNAQKEGRIFATLFPNS